MRWSRENAFDSQVSAASLSTGVEAALIKAVIAVESGFNPAAMNYGDPGYAWGLMQMIPTTARGLGYTGPMGDLLTDTGQAILLGARLLRENQQRAGTVQGAVSAYNGGYRPSLGFGQPKPGTGQYANQEYVDRVMDALRYFRSGGTAASGSGGGATAQAGTPFRGGGDPGAGGDAPGLVPPTITPMPTVVLVRLPRMSWWERFWRWVGGIEL